MAATAFTKADVQRAIDAALKSGVTLREVLIEKTGTGSSIRLILTDLQSSQMPADNNGLEPESW